MCSKCGCKNEIIKNLNIRNYEYPNCERYLDRDYNVSENVMFNI
ncbi:MAG: transposase [Bacilli bacterium]|nr:transposase [Bacilli bacterium]